MMAFKRQLEPSKVANVGFKLPDFSGIIDLLPEIIAKLNQSFAENLNALKCIYGQAKRQERYSELEFGRIGDGELVVRSVDALQFVDEATVTQDVTVDVRQGSGYFPRDGYVANLGDNPFMCVLVGATSDRITAKFTVVPGTSYAIRSPISAVKIFPIDAQEAFYQVSAV
jgi:hypothetical protein